ncbi:Tyrosyl-tRNA synthetase [Candidatus Vidania fulgoroideae]|uniref:Tyrosine--tRNA ligase n=1 Tax=Candidatus Vidania fulgoroideorum TaxID=881286 RepID=A0A346E0B9_9PROT|nr:Tyrosyl-tRNA synthetase [Candidatus Vidania fulgoroideae]WDI79369.1 tyrosine--tRNA ligase [Candidatus Vidania fulgoroideae]WDR79274.1 tyrosine--tRNA ligase [Candidatus Vidania fulgoroideae]
MIIKFGIDTNASLHLGHLYILKKIEKYMKKDDVLIFLLGDFTCKIGDPSMRKNYRKIFDFNIKKNIKTIIKYTSIFFKKRIFFLKNSFWFKNIRFEKILRIFNVLGIKKLIIRRDIKNRLENNKRVILGEILYPILQSYDNLIIKPDIELGGKDQKINFKITKEIQKIFTKKKTKFIEFSLLEGLRSKKKMSKSKKYDCIFLNDNTKNIFWKILKINDLKISYFINKFKFLLKKYIFFKVNKNIFLLTKIYFFYNIIKIFKKNVKDFNFYYKFKIKNIKLENENIIDTLIKNKIFFYKKEIKRLLKQKCIFLNNKLLTNRNIKIKKNDKLVIGKKIYIIK